MLYAFTPPDILLKATLIKLKVCLHSRRNLDLYSRSYLPRQKQGTKKYLKALQATESHEITDVKLGTTCGAEVLILAAKQEYSKVAPLLAL